MILKPLGSMYQDGGSSSPLGSPTRKSAGGGRLGRTGTLEGSKNLGNLASTDFGLPKIEEDQVVENSGGIATYSAKKKTHRKTESTISSGQVQDTPTFN